jgi:hypothetical protein
VDWGTGFADVASDGGGEDKLGDAVFVSDIMSLEAAVE